MRRILGVTTVLCMLLGGTAFADRHGRHGGGHGGGGGGGGVVVRDHRGPAPGPSRVVVRDHRSGPSRVRVTNGRYVFPGGVVRVYNRPVIRAHYYNQRVRPAII